MNFKSSFRTFAAALVLLAAGAFHSEAAISTYTTTVTNATSLTITNAQHGMNSWRFGANVLDSNGVLVLTGYTVSVDQSTYQASFTFSPAFTGTIKLVGPKPDSPTTASTDFETTHNGAGVLTVCSACSANAPAKRGSSGTGNYHTYATPQVYRHGSGSYTLRVWIDSRNIIHFGISTLAGMGAYGTCDSSAVGYCQVDYNVTSFPSAVFQIAHATVIDGSNPFYSGIVDDRGF